jgi:acetyl-CoA carboxylase carboxyl transferase subunit beta
VALPEVTADPKIPTSAGSRPHQDARARTGMNDAIKIGTAARAGTVIAVQDFDFMGGSLGMAAGEAIVQA